MWTKSFYFIIPPQEIASVRNERHKFSIKCFLKYNQAWTPLFALQWVWATIPPMTICFESFAVSLSYHPANQHHFSYSARSCEKFAKKAQTYTISSRMQYFEWWMGPLRILNFFIRSLNRSIWILAFAIRCVLKMSITDIGALFFGL